MIGMRATPVSQRCAGLVPVWEIALISLQALNFRRTTLAWTVPDPLLRDEIEVFLNSFNQLRMVAAEIDYGAPLNVASSIA